MRRLYVLASKASTEVLSWKVDGRLGNLSLSVPDWAKKQLDMRAVFDMQMGVCLEHSFESRQKDGVKDGASGGSRHRQGYFALRAALSQDLCGTTSPEEEKGR